MTLILFDVDGTLVDVQSSGRWAMNRAFEAVFGLADAEPFSRGLRFDGLTDPIIVGAIARAAGIPESALQEKAGAFERTFLEKLASRLETLEGKRALPGVVDLLDRLAGVSMASVGLLTGNIEKGARLKLSSVGLSGYFETGAFGSDAADRATIGRIARQRFEEKLGCRIEPREVTVVGDSLADIQAARENGYRCLAVGTGWTDPDVLRAENPDLFMPDLTDFGRTMQFIFGTRGTPSG